MQLQWLKYNRMKGSPDRHHLLTNNNRKFPNKDLTFIRVIL